MRSIWPEALVIGLGLGALVGLEACQFFGQSTERSAQSSSEHPTQTRESPPKQYTVPHEAKPPKGTEDAHPSDKEASANKSNMPESAAKPARDAEPAPELTDTFMADSRITVAVQMKLTGDRKSNFARVNVETSHGVVTLTGTVDSVEEKRRATELARRIDGVSRVDNNLQIE